MQKRATEQNAQVSLREQWRPEGGDCVVAARFIKFKHDGALYYPPGGTWLRRLNRAKTGWVRSHCIIEFYSKGALEGRQRKRLPPILIPFLGSQPLPCISSTRTTQLGQSGLNCCLLSGACFVTALGQGFPSLSLSFSVFCPRSRALPSPLSQRRIPDGLYEVKLVEAKPRTRRQNHRTVRGVNKPTIPSEVGRPEGIPNEEASWMRSLLKFTWQWPGSAPRATDVEGNKWRPALKHRQAGCCVHRNI